MNHHMVAAAEGVRPKDACHYVVTYCCSFRLRHSHVFFTFWLLLLFRLWLAMFF
jgi:hypothetical protein